MSDAPSTEGIGILERTLQRTQRGTTSGLTAFLTTPSWLVTKIQEKANGKPFWSAAKPRREVIQRNPLDTAFLLPWKEQESQEVPIQPFRLLDLPEELQAIILENALGPWDAHGFNGEKEKYRFTGSERIRMGFVIFGCPRPTAMSLLLTNRHLHNLTLNALHNTFTGHLSVMNSRRGPEGLQPWLKITTSHPTFLTYRWVLERVTIFRTDLPALGKAWKPVDAPDTSLNSTEKLGVHVLPKLQRIEYDLTPIRAPFYIEWSQTDLRQFRIGENDSAIIEKATQVTAALAPEFLSISDNNGFEYYLTLPVAVGSAVTRYRKVVAMVQVCPRPAKVLKRVIKLANGRVEWQGRADSLAPLPNKLPGELATRWDMYDLWELWKK